MKYVTMGSAILLGLVYTVFGLNFWFHFIPMQPMAGQAGALMGALFGSGYMFTVIKVIEVLGGLLLLSGFARPFALVILAPITLNIFLFHAILAPAGMYMQVIMLVLHLYLGYAYRASFAPLFKKG